MGGAPVQGSFEHVGSALLTALVGGQADPFGAVLTIKPGVCVSIDEIEGDLADEGGGEYAEILVQVDAIGSEAADPIVSLIPDARGSFGKADPTGAPLGEGIKGPYTQERTVSLIVDNSAIATQRIAATARVRFS